MFLLVINLKEIDNPLSPFKEGKQNPGVGH